MSQYRLSRNVEASIVDYITTELSQDSWSVRVEKAFAQVYKGELPCVCINSPDRPIIRREIGSDITTKEIMVDIRIFAKNDGFRLDLADWMIEKLLSGIDYYEYTITNGAVSNKDLKGRINLIRIISSRKELENTENLVQEDRYRHLIICECRVALI